MCGEYVHFEMRDGKLVCDSNPPSVECPEVTRLKVEVKDGIASIVEFLDKLEDERDKSQKLEIKLDETVLANKTLENEMLTLRAQKLYQGELDKNTISILEKENKRLRDLSFGTREEADVFKENEKLKEEKKLLFESQKYSSDRANEFAYVNCNLREQNERLKALLRQDNKGFENLTFEKNSLIAVNKNLKETIADLSEDLAKADNHCADLVNEKLELIKEKEDLEKRLDNTHADRMRTISDKLALMKKLNEIKSIVNRHDPS